MLPVPLRQWVFFVPPKREPISEEELAFLPHQRAVDETGSSLSLPKDPDILGSMIHLLFLDLEVRKQKLAALLDVDTAAIHQKPESLCLPEALRHFCSESLPF